MKVDPSDGRNGFLRRFQQLRSYREEIETRDREKIPFSSQIHVVTRYLSVAEGPALHNAHIYKATRPIGLELSDV